MSVSYLCYRVSVASERCQSHICVTGLVLPVRGVSLMFDLQGWCSINPASFASDGF